MLGTLVVVEIPGDFAEPSAAIEAAFAAIGRVEERMHPSRAGSDLARLATAAPGHAVALDAWTIEVLELARRLNQDSGEAFDPCLPTAPGRMCDLELQDSQAICRQRVDLDLGGIAKGFAVDRAVDALRRLGVGSGLVNAGGDLRVFGHETRTIHARTQDGPVLAVELRDGALAVSGPRGAASPAEHRGFYHGKSGVPVAGRTVAVAAPTAAVADALCKCVMLCDTVLSGELLGKYGAQRVYG